jgi:hypothetical protein
MLWESLKRFSDSKKESLEILLEIAVSSPIIWAAAQPMLRVVLTRRRLIMSENRRKSELGRFGETVVCERLAQNGYTCTYLGSTNRCFDIEAYKDSRKFLFSVKTRNHTTYCGDIKKDYYNLFFSREPSNPHAVVNAAFEIARGRSAIPMRAAVRVDTARQTFDIYYGRVIDLPDKRYIPMGPSDRLKHLKLAQDELDQRIDPAWSNVRKRPSSLSPRLEIQP